MLAAVNCASNHFVARIRAILATKWLLCEFCANSNDDERLASKL